MKQIRKLIKAVAAALGLAAGLTAAAPWAAAQETPFFGEVVDVRVINVEAVVTSRGERLHGLQKEDFRLLVDKAEVPIEYFSETGAPGTNPSGISYVVFIDDFFSLPSRRDPALEKLRVNLALLRPEDRMAIVAYDGRRLTMLSPPTGDRVQLQRVLAEAKKRPSYGLQRRSEANRTFSLMRQMHRESGGSFTGIGYDGAGRSVTYDIEPVQEMLGKVERLSVAAASALRGFQGGEGRKVLLMFSGGVPLSVPDAALFSDPLRNDPQPYARARNLYSTLLEAANRLGYTVYPIDLSVTPAGNLPTAEVGSIGDAQRLRDSNFDVQGVNEDLLFQLASATGGVPLFDGSRVPVLERVQEDLSSYYWLGFRPTWKGDDRNHQVRIEVLRKGAKVRTRNGFADLSRDSQLDLQVESAHLFDAPLPVDSSFAIHAGDPRPEGAGKMLVSASFEIPADQLSWRKDGGDNVAHPELRIVGTDELGNSADMPREIIELRLPGEIQKGQKALYQSSIKLRRRPHRLLVTLYDPPSGRLLAQKISILP